jgi:hypothetical protein
MVIAVTMGAARADEPPCGWWNHFCAPEGGQPFKNDDRLMEPPADGGGTPPGLYEDPGAGAPGSSTHPKSKRAPEKNEIRYETADYPKTWPPIDRHMWHSPPPASLPPAALTRRGFWFGPGR